MAYMYNHFIPQNTAPKGAKAIGVYDESGKKICTIPLGTLSPKTETPLYSFGIASDLHIYPVVAVEWMPETKFDNALTFFEKQGCIFCVATGDLTQTGFYLRTNDSDPSTQYLDKRQFAKYKEICEKHGIPVYELMGNHESIYGVPITNDLDLLNVYTGKNVLSYTVAQGNDIFIFCGQNNYNSVMSDTDFQWLGQTLEANKNKRCFVFIHPYLEEDSGDPLDLRENSVFEDWGTTKTNAFINLMRKYPKAVLFHGHSHMKFECQELDKNANYTERNGFKSVHIPSLGRPRTVDLETNTTPYADNEGQGYIVDVYSDCIVLNGYDLVNQKLIPLGILKINVAEEGEDGK